MAAKYFPKNFEKKWAERWWKNKIYKTPLNPEKKKEKKYVLSMFPYPSGAGLHVGHVRIYTGTDVLARFFRMNGKAVLHPMGWDAFGLPAENAAVKAKKNPLDMVPKNIENFKRQMIMLGFSYDWEKELATTNPEYYRWTQWLFIQFFKMGLLYKKNTPINYCPKCKTGLAEEEVLSDGTHERCGSKIIKKDLPQWIFRITKYADRLLSDLKGLDWPEGILAMQRNWIGRKEGININYKVINSEVRHRIFESTSPPKGGSPKSLTQKQVSSLPEIDIITCFTTRPDTNFGATFIVLAPEHPFVKKILEGKFITKETDIEAIRKYVEESLSKTEIEREAEGRKKTGVFTGFYAINNLNGREMPIWISDFVLMGFGTGAVVGVPGHDRRDFEFAKEFGIDIIRVVVGKDGDTSPITKIKQVYEEDGTLINSEFLNGLNVPQAIKKMITYLEEKGWGKRVVSYHLRDWIFSRQRYWGEPIPMVNCEKCGWNPIPESELPLKLPYIKSYEPTETGESPLSVIPEFVNTTCPNCGGPAKRETDTMPNWAGSCWYFLAFSFWNQEKENSKLKIKNLKLNENFKLKIKNFGQWLPVDWYLGGAEHAVLHLLYSRFWVKALYDLGLLNFQEPFLRLRNVGMVLAEDNRKMSKSFGNVINPDDVVSEYGADSLRLYEMFMAPFNQEITWSTKALQGCYRFLKRVWEIYEKFKVQSAKFKVEEDKNLVAKLNKTIKKVTEDISQIKFNTAIAAMMEFVNEWEKSLAVEGNEASIAKGSRNSSPPFKTSIATDKRLALSVKQAKDFLKILAPFAPFITEEIWHEIFEEKESIHLSSWPKAEVVEDEEVIIPIQVNGKLRETIKVQRSTLNFKKEIEKKALEQNRIKKYLEGKKYRFIYVEGKVGNFVLE
jgi:leucyl-tRNA synthetase